MTVYVDNMRTGYRQMVMCHMLADSESELHTMADQIGIKRQWYQGDHYDICLSKRTLALKAGAIEITARQAAANAPAAAGNRFSGAPRRCCCLGPGVNA